MTAVQETRFGQNISARTNAGDTDSARAAERTNESIFVDCAASRTPKPPATIKVVIGAEDRKPRASISTPAELRTAPDVSAST